MLRFPSKTAAILSNDYHFKNMWGPVQLILLRSYVETAAILAVTYKKKDGVFSTLRVFSFIFYLSPSASSSVSLSASPSLLSLILSTSQPLSSLSLISLRTVVDGSLKSNEDRSVRRPLEFSFAFSVRRPLEFSFASPVCRLIEFFLLSSFFLFRSIVNLGSESIRIKESHQFEVRIAIWRIWVFVNHFFSAIVGEIWEDLLLFGYR